MNSSGQMLRAERYLRLIASVMFLALGAYAAAFIWQQSESGTVTEKAEFKRISESFSVKGSAYRELVPISSDGDDYVILAAEGEYLSGGSAVAVKKENADDYFAYCDYRLCRKHFASEEEAVEAIKSGDAALRAWAVMYLEGESAPEKARKPEGLIYAPCAGIFAPTKEGIGAITSDVNWYFSFESEKAPLLNKGQKVNLKISSGPETDAEVFSIDGNSAVLIVRSCSDFIPQEETYSAEISISDCEGIKVPRKAMHFDDDGNAFVYVLSAGITEKKNVEIIYTSRSFYLCGEAELRRGMEILVSDTLKAG